MLFLGSQGHFRDVISEFRIDSFNELAVFDDVTPSNELQVPKGFLTITSVEDAKTSLIDKRFILALGSPDVRKKLYQKFTLIGFEPFSFIAKSAIISDMATIGVGSNIMHQSSILGNAIVGTGVLINSHASIHHDSFLGDFVNISPGARVLGRCSIGNHTDIGSNAVILPNCVIGKNVIVGAGSVVTSNIPDNTLVVGIPGKVIRSIR